MVTRGHIFTGLSDYTLSAEEISVVTDIAGMTGHIMPDRQSVEENFFAAVTTTMDLFCIERVDGEIPVSVRVGAGLVLAECGYDVELPAGIAEVFGDCPLIDTQIVHPVAQEILHG